MLKYLARCILTLLPFGHTFSFSHEKPLSTVWKQSIEPFINPTSPNLKTLNTHYLVMYPVIALFFSLSTNFFFITISVFAPFLCLLLLSRADWICVNKGIEMRITSNVNQNLLYWSLEGNSFAADTVLEWYLCCSLRQFGHWCIAGPVMMLLLLKECPHSDIFQWLFGWGCWWNLKHGCTSNTSWHNWKEKGFCEQTGILI